MPHQITEAAYKRVHDALVTDPGLKGRISKPTVQVGRLKLPQEVVDVADALTVAGRDVKRLSPNQLISGATEVLLLDSIAVPTKSNRPVLVDESDESEAKPKAARKSKPEKKPAADTKLKKTPRAERQPRAAKTDSKIEDESKAAASQPHEEPTPEPVPAAVEPAAPADPLDAEPGPADADGPADIVPPRAELPVLPAKEVAATSEEEEQDLEEQPVPEAASSKLSRPQDVRREERLNRHAATMATIKKNAPQIRPGLPVIPGAVIASLYWGVMQILTPYEEDAEIKSMMEETNSLIDRARALTATP